MTDLLIPLQNIRKILFRRVLAVTCLQALLFFQSARGSNVMNYGADGNDYFQFTTPSMAFDKASGFSTLITFAMHVDADGTLEIGGGPVCRNGSYIGPTNWATLVNTLKTPPTTVTRYEVCIGGWGDSSYDNIKSLIATQGTTASSILYQNFQALKNAVPSIDAINDDDEQTYDLSSTVSLANMLGSLGYKFTTAPYSHQSFWVSLNNSITNCDYIYLQCYAGGAGNDPAQWNTAFGHGVKVIPGQESNTANPATFRNWYLQTSAPGGFYYPDVVFASTYWSAAIFQANGLVPAAPTGLLATVNGNRAKLSWNVVPGAISYNVKRATRSGNELTVTNISAVNNSWPASNQFFDALPKSGVTNYYKVSAVNTNGESLASLEVGVGTSDVAIGPTNGLLAYEGFDYPGGEILSGQFGGLGWSNGWMDVSATASDVINVGSLIASSNAPGGFDKRSAGNAAFIANNSRGGRWLDCSTNGPFATAGYLNASGNIGAPGKTLYVSFLQQPNSPAQFYEFEFHRGDLGDPGRIAGIGNDLANATTVNLRAPSNVHTPLGLGNTNVNFYLLRIDYHGGNDDVTVYRNPASQKESDNEPVLTMVGVADLSFNGISLATYLNGVTVNHDEIRLGTNWSSVLGNPPVFVIQPTNQFSYAGQSVTFVTLAQSSQPLNYQWYQGTNALPGETNSNLTLANVQMTAANQYSVTVSNALGSANSDAATLTVQTISATIASAQSVIVGPGSNLVINANIGGASPLTLQWYKDGKLLPGATNATYASSNVDAFNAGQYFLVASNSYGSVTSSVVTAFPNFGSLLAYEGFNYGASSSDIGGANGGFGWAAPWVSVNGGASQSFSNSLVAGTNAPTGYDTHSLGGALLTANASRKGRFLDCSATGPFAQHGYLDTNGNIGADGTTLYVSFLQQPSSTSPFYEFEFKRGDLGDGGRIAGIGNDVGSGNNDANLRIESPAGGASAFYDLGPGNTGVNFYVVRIDYHTGNDTVTVYRNPTSLVEPAAPTLVVSNIADLSFNGISFGAYLNGVTVSHDEVRFGMTWADAVGGTISRLRWQQSANGAANLVLVGSPNYAYAMQSATNLAGPWTNLGNMAMPALGIAKFVVTNSGDAQHFYRAANGLTASAPGSTDVVIADFEQSDYGAWTITGTAFGSGPASGTLLGQQTVSGFQGSGLVNSFNGGDATTGTLTLPPFVITKPYLDFLIGGGNLPGQACLNLVISNVIVATATGANSETLTPRQWDVSAYGGQTATLQIVDSATGGWGHILVDQITLSDVAFPSLSRTLLLTNNLLNLPVKNSATMKRVTVTVGGVPVRDFNIKLADGTPDWWAFVDVSGFSNQTATFSVNSLAPGSTGLSSITQTNGILGATNLYREALRPQIHFSSKRGWLNDANGMFYYHGQYHLYYQHDPFNWDGSGQKWWGHPVSSDMVHWQELPEGIYSHTYGDDVWSGSAVVDAANTGGFKSGTNDVIVAAFYSTARGECIAFSNDGGLSFTDYTNNPVATHSGQGRDPHLFWYAPSNYWVMAVYDDAGGNGVQFYSTPDFRHWTFRSKIYNGFFECPDMFQLPVDGNTNNLMWVLCDASSGYQLGQFDGAIFTPATQKIPGNLGSGFYASQTFTAMSPGDRKVRIGWAMLSMPGMPFNQAMFFPTTLALNTTSNGVRLCSQPVAEISNLVANTYSWTNLTLTPSYNPLSGIRGGLFNVQAQFTPGTATAINFTLCGVTVSYSPSAQQITCNGNTQSLPPINGTVTLELICDRQMLEIFGNGGQLYMPIAGTSFNATNNMLSLTSQGSSTVFQSLTVNKLKPSWPTPSP